MNHDELEARAERAYAALHNDRQRLLNIIDSFDTAEIYYLLTGERRSDTLAAMDLDKLEAFAGTGK